MEKSLIMETMRNHRDDAISKRQRPRRTRSFSTGSITRCSSEQLFRQRGKKLYAHCDNRRQRRGSGRKTRQDFDSTETKGKQQQSTGSEFAFSEKKSITDSRSIKNVSSLLHLRLTMDGSLSKEDVSQDFPNLSNNKDHSLVYNTAENHPSFIKIRTPCINDRDVNFLDTTASTHFGECLQNMPFKNADEKPVSKGNQDRQMKQTCPSCFGMMNVDDLNDKLYSFPNCGDSCTAFNSNSKPYVNGVLSSSCPEYSRKFRPPLTPYQSPTESNSVLVCSSVNKESGLLESRKLGFVKPDCYFGKVSSPFEQTDSRIHSKADSTVVKTTDKDVDCSQEGEDNKDCHNIKTVVIEKELSHPGFEKIGIPNRAGSRTYTERELTLEKENAYPSLLRKLSTVILNQVDDNEDDDYQLLFESLKSMLCQEVPKDENLNGWMEVEDENTAEVTQADRLRSYKNLLAHPPSFQCAVCNSNLEISWPQCLGEDCEDVIPTFARDGDYKDMSLYCPWCCCRRGAYHPR